MPSCAKLFQSLMDSLRGRAREFKITSDVIKVIKQIKDKIAQASTLTHPNSHSHSTFERELLSIYLTTEHFRPMSEGRKHIFYTDHKPSINALTARVYNNSREVQHVNYISQRISDIRHAKG